MASASAPSVPGVIFRWISASLVVTVLLGSTAMIVTPRFLRLRYIFPIGVLEWKRLLVHKSSVFVCGRSGKQIPFPYIDFHARADAWKQVLDSVQKFGEPKALAKRKRAGRYHFG